MKKFIYTALILSAALILLTAFSKKPKGFGSLFVDVSAEGKSFDNIYVAVGEWQFGKKAAWGANNIYLSRIPTGEYDVKVYAFDSIDGNYYFERPAVYIEKGKTTKIKDLTFDEDSKAEGIDFPNRYNGQQRTVVIDGFPQNEAATDNIELREGFMGIIGNKDWTKEVDALVDVLLASYSEDKTGRFIIVRGYASTVEDEPLQLSLLRAKNIVSYITANYMLEKELFAVFGESTNRLAKKRDPLDNDNMRVEITYDY